MKRLALLAIPVVALILSPMRTSAAGPLGVLPPSARLLASVAVPGTAGNRAVTYLSPRPMVGLIAGNSLRWSHPLPFQPTRLRAPFNAPVFLGGGNTTKGGMVFAFAVTSSGVQSAIAEHASGLIRTEEAVHIGKRAFSVLRHDTHHTGSVAYRTVSSFTGQDGLFQRTKVVEQPDYAAGSEPAPNATVTTGAGDTYLLRLQIANTEAERERGLMYVKSLDPDSGMIFVWTSNVLDYFWMENTYIPLTVAFLSADGTIMEMQDMAPQTTDPHMASAPYRYAIEVNQGYFAAHGITVGDRLKLDLQSASAR